MSCDKQNQEPEQDYTSFVFIHHVTAEFPNCVAAYLDVNNNYIRIASIGTLKKDVESQEITLTDESISEIYLFTDYLSPRRFDAVYKVKKLTKNIFEIIDGTGGISVDDITDPSQYPQ